MASRHLLFRIFYRLGVTPWDGHPLPTSLTNLIEGDHAPTPATALDIGCGTGDNSIYLARHGWQVTGVDYVQKAVDKARAKSSAEGVDVRFEQADATRLGEQNVGSDFALIIDNGCLHGMNDEDRIDYVREVTAAAAPGARLLLVEFIPGGSYGVPGIEPSEVAQRFEGPWTLLASGSEPAMNHNGKDPGRFYLLARAS